MPSRRLLPLVALLSLAACNGLHKKPPPTAVPPNPPAAATPAPTPETPTQSAAAPTPETPATTAPPAATPPAPEPAPANPTLPEQAAAAPAVPETAPIPAQAPPPVDPFATVRTNEAQRHDKASADIKAVEENRALRQQQWLDYRDQLTQLQAKRQSGGDLMGPWQQAQAALSSLDSSLQLLADLDKTLAGDEKDANDAAGYFTAQAAQPGAPRADLTQLADQATQDAAAIHGQRPRVVIELNEQVDMVKAERDNLPSLLKPGTPAVTAETPVAAQAAAPAPAAPVGPPKLVVKPTQSPAEYEPALYRVAKQALDQSTTSRAVVTAVEPGAGPPTARKIAAANIRHLAQAVGRALIDDGFDAAQVAIVVRTDANATDGQVRVGIAP